MEDVFAILTTGFGKSLVFLAVTRLAKAALNSEGTIIDNGFGDARLSAAAIGKFEDIERIMQKKVRIAKRN